MNWIYRLFNFLHPKAIKKAQELLLSDDEKGLTYKIIIDVSCISVPPQENIPEKLSLTFKTRNKDEAVKLILSTLGSHWTELKKSCEKLASIQRMEKLDK